MCAPDAAAAALAATALHGITDPSGNFPDKLLRASCELLNVEQGSLTLLDGDSLRIAASFSHDAAIVGKTIPRRGSVAWAVIDHGREMHLSGVFDNRRSNYETFRHSLVLPIRDAGRIIGTLNVNRRATPFAPADLEIGELATAVIGRALAFARELREDRHPLQSGLQLALAGMPAAARERARTIAATVSRLARIAGEDAPRLTLAAQYCELAQVILDDTTVSGHDSLRPLLPALSAVLARGLGADPELYDLLALASERFDGRGARGLGGGDLAIPPQLLALARALRPGMAGDLAEQVDRAAREDPGAFAPALIARLLAATP